MNQLTHFLKVFVPLVVLLSTITVLAYQYHKTDIFHEVVSEYQTSLSFKEEYMGDFFRSAIADLYYLSNSNIPNEIISKSSASSGAINDLAIFSQSARRYDQLRMLDTSGLEIFRVNYSNERPIIVDENELQDKAHRYYFQDIKDIPFDQIYVSPIDLNIEFRKIEIPYKPVTRIIAPIEKNQELKGYLVSNIDLREFFNDLKEIKNEHFGKFMLLNNSGYWLLAPDGYTTFGFMKPSSNAENFKQLHPKEWQKIRSNKKGYFKNSKGLFVFKNVQFKSFIQNLPYLPENLLTFPEENNLTILFHVPKDDYRSTINKDLNYLIFMLSIILTLSGILAYYNSKSKIIDIKSKNKLLEKNNELEDLILQLESRNDQLREYSQIVSHDLRSPIANLNMLIQMHQEMEDPTEREIIYKKLEKVAGAINWLLNDLVEAVKVLNVQNLKLEKCSLSATMEKINNLLAHDLESTGATININNQSWDEIIYPQIYFESILQNLMTNAIKYRRKNVPLIITIESLFLDNKKIIKFEDNGSGIDLKRNKNLIFKLHKRFHRNISGKGLGLFITKTQIESQGGKISVTSVPNEGTEFKIFFNKH